ncbi:MAG: transporter substrate-binding domain-containing protein [Planctomycetota bacterium]
MADEHSGMGSKARAAPARGRPKVNEPVRPEFAALVREHLGTLGWSQQHLLYASRNALTRSQLSAWLACERAIGRHDVNRITWAIARGYEQRMNKAGRHHPTEGLGTLDHLLNQMLDAAGYTPMEGRGLNKRFAKLARLEHQQQALTVGFARAPGLISPEHNGFIAHVTRRVGRLMGLSIEWREYEWRTLIDGLRSGAVDAIAPFYIKLPSRMFRIRFSDPLPGVRVQVNAVLHRDCLGEATGTGEQVASVHDLDHSKIKYGYIAGEAGEVLSMIMAGGHGLDRHEAHASAESAWEEISRTPRVAASGRARVLVVDTPTCQKLCAEHAEATMLLRPGSDAPKMGLHFAVHLDEPELALAINESLNVMRETGMFESLHREFGQYLLESGVHVEAGGMAAGGGG